MKKMQRGVFGLLCLLAIFPLSAAELAKVTIPDQITLEGSDNTLVLNGAGIRYKFIFKIYIGALYLSEKTSVLEEIINSVGPKRILMHFLYDKVDKQDLDKAWREGFSANLDEPAMIQLEPQINRFSALFTDAVKGDEIWLDNIPEAGTRVYINGALKDTIPGQDFYPALLSIWIGSDPVTTALKRAMLGQE